MNNAKVVKKHSKFKIEDYLGKRFGRLIILSEANPYINPTSGQRRTKVFAKCDCGVIGDYILFSLKNGGTNSCGCYCIEVARKRRTIHGQSILDGTFEYKAWCNIKTRCYNPNTPSYKDYGGRGISLCDEWLNNFPQFLQDMGNSPSPKHSIERKEVNEGYSKENCIWANIHTQAANRRNSNKNVGVNFDSFRNKWKARLTINKKLVLCKEFDTELDAVKARKQKEKEYGIYIS